MENKNNNTGQELIKNPDSALQTTESLPVLAAFSDFIKTEQRRSRNRMLFMGFIFTLMIIVIICAGIFVGTTFYNQVHADLRQTKNDLNNYHIKSEIAKNKTEERLAQIQAIANNIAKNISLQEQALQETQKSFNSNKENYKQELSNMKQVINTLSLENKELKKEADLANTQLTKLPTLTAQIKDLLNIITNPATLPAETNQNEPITIEKTAETTKDTKTPESKTREAVSEIVEVPEIIKSTYSLKLNIKSPDSDEDIMMLMPIPE